MECRKKGYMKIKDRCVRKRYNPFKMWGTWVALFLGLTLGFGFSFIFSAGTWAEDANKYFWFVYSGVVILSFFVGWGIHSLVRRYS